MEENILHTSLFIGVHRKRTPCKCPPQEKDLASCSYTWLENRFDDEQREDFDGKESKQFFVGIF